MLRLYLPLSDYSLSSSLNTGETIELIEERNYIANVYRMRVGDSMLCFNESGEFICELVSLDKKTATIKVIEKTDRYEEKPKMNLAMPLIKPNRLEWVIEKAVEIGVGKIFLIETERSMKKNADLRRLHLIIKQAVQQSMRLHLPEIIVCTMNDLLNKDFQSAEKISICLAHQDGNCGEINPHTAPNTVSVNTILNTVLIGPEGGFTDSEMEQLSKYPKVKLSDGILRSETAALLGLYMLHRSID